MQIYYIQSYKFIYSDLTKKLTYFYSFKNNIHSCLKVRRILTMLKLSIQLVRNEVASVYNSLDAIYHFTQTKNV